MVLGFIRGQFIDVIDWTDDTRDTMVWRFERYGNEIKYGAKLTVREGQNAVFVHEGQIADVFGPGLYLLETNNLPILTTLQHWDHGFSSPFKSEIYFVSMTRFNDNKWGTKNPIMCRDPEFGPVRLRAFGTYALRVSDAGTFIREVVGTDGEFTTDEVSSQVRNIVVQEVSRVLAGSGIPVLDMAANTGDLGKLVTEAIKPTIAAYGLVIPEFYIENISLPEEVEKALDKRTSMGIVGDLSRFAQYAAADAMTKAAENPGTAGAVVGMAMGNMMVQGPWGAAPAPAGGAAAVPPPPPVAETQWHVTANGQTSGPFGRAELQQMAAAGTLTAASHVWTAGQDGWKRAGDVSELAALLAQVPPPPPA